MFDAVSGAVLIMLMRVCDVSIGTIRTILIVQGKKYIAGIAGFIEVLIWVFAIRFIFQHLDNYANLFGYALGFGLGNILGIAIENKIGLGYVQINIISKHFTDQIANKLRGLKYGATILPAEGGSGGVSIIVIIIARKYQKRLIHLVEEIDKDAFITVQHSLPYRGFIHGARK
ncbi:MAG: DUF2179 domain-containing protein [Ignavibacteriales bacterium]|nr:MAG: DUF2179 domain-containing protein [Ignavibacteriales bacterium]